MIYIICESQFFTQISKHKKFLTHQWVKNDTTAFSGGYSKVKIYTTLKIEVCFYLDFNLTLSIRKSQELKHAHRERHWVRNIYRNYFSLAVMAPKLFSYCQKSLLSQLLLLALMWAQQLKCLLSLWFLILGLSWYFFFFTMLQISVRLMLSNMIVISDCCPSCSCRRRGKQTKRTHSHFGF